jgi:hypothetical protein
MLKIFLIITGILLVGVAFLSVSIWAKPNGRFPNIHVGKNPAMRKHKIGCVEAQDSEAQISNKLSVSEKNKH